MIYIWPVLIALHGCAYQKSYLGDMPDGMRYAKLAAMVYSSKLDVRVKTAPMHLVVRVWDDYIDCGEGQRCDGKFQNGEIDIVDRGCLSDSSFAHELAHYHSVEAFGNAGGDPRFAARCSNQECLDHADPRVFRGENSFVEYMNRIWRASQCKEGFS